MTSKDWYLENLLKSSSLPEKIFQIEAYDRFGHLKVGALAESTISLNNIKESRASSLAEEAMLSLSLGETVPENLNSFLSNIRPFGSNTPPFKRLSSFQFASSVFPLKGDRYPLFAHLWVCKDEADVLGPDNLDQLEDSESIHEKYPDIKVFIVHPRRTDTIKGDSWQLAFHMALHGLDDKTFSRQLAEDWLVTGSVNSGEICHVELGNKLELATKRNWLLPRANHGEWKENWRPKGRVLTAVSIEEAIDRISGRGVQRGGKLEWPEGFSRMFSFSSRAETTVAAATIMSDVDELVLLPSTNDCESYIPAVNIRDFLRKHTETNIIIPDYRIPSDDVYKIEKYIEKVMTDLNDGNPSEKTFFHITTGNKLMSFAAANIARRDPNVYLVYRDKDNTGHDFTTIFYNGREPSTAVLVRNSIPQRVQWPIFERSGKHENPDWRDDMLELLKATKFREAEYNALGRPFLIGNAFPMGLIQRKVSIKPKSIKELREVIARRRAVSFWGHVRTAGIASELLAWDVTPEKPRPAITLDKEGYPKLDAVDFRECWILAPEYAPDYRPDIGSEVKPSEIIRWRVNKMKWLES